MSNSRLFTTYPPLQHGAFVRHRTMVNDLFVGPGGIVMLITAVYLALLLHVYEPNMAGDGVNMPQNLLAWSAMGLCTLVTCLGIISTGRTVFSPLIPAGLVAVVLIVLPALWDPYRPWLLHAVPHLAGTIGALVYAVTLIQIPLSPSRRRLLLSLVMVAALVQALTGLMQAWLPDIALRLMEFRRGSSPYGIFQQRNVLASFLATGAAATLWLALTASTRRGALALLTAMYPLVACIVITQSRIGALGMLTMLIAAGVADRRRALRHRGALLRRLFFLVSLGLCAAFVANYAMPAGQQPDFSHDGSTAQRARVLAGTWTLIKQHPLAGSGYGSFESRFPQALEQTGLVSLESDTFTHPHNEFLYAWSEGGILALTGLLLLAGLWLWPVLQSALSAPPFIQPDNKNGTASWLLPLSGLPVLMHMMTEYPLYTSVPHLMVMLILYRAGLPDKSLRTIRLSRQRWRGGLTVLLLLIATAGCLAGLTFLKEGLDIQRELTRDERSFMAGGHPVLPVPGWRTLFARERLDYDQHMMQALQPGYLQKVQSAEDFTVWGNRWLAVHNDAEVFAGLIMTARRRGDIHEVHRLQKLAHRVFVNDPRFALPGGRG
ncbi:pilin glycosylation ligase domain-containing protein [Enterobacter hormaechei subsp. steigerwaltii]